jgi:hypothetical protein
MAIANQATEFTMILTEEERAQLLNWLEQKLKARQKGSGVESGEIENRTRVLLPTRHPRSIG